MELNNFARRMIMSKNILILTGSPRKHGNSDLLANAFIKGIHLKGHNAFKFDTASKTIHGCKACNTCWSKGNACSFHDGFSELEPLLEKADVIAFASPLYWFGMSAHIKAAIDKFYAYTGTTCKKPLKIKESFLLTCGAEKEIEWFNGIVESYRSMIKYMNWEDKGTLVAPGVYEKGDIEKTDALQRAEELGMSI